MAKTGPQKYPPASLAYWHQDRYPGGAMESNVGVIHTTEGTTVPTYGGGSSAPNFTALPDIPGKRLRWYQHFDFDTSSRALVNLAGGAETNRLNAVQIELVGTCDPKYKTSWGTRRAGRDYVFWPDAPDWALAELGKFVKWAHDEHGIRLQSTVTWKAYPGSYGTNNGVRLNAQQWAGYYGWLGHQHVVENLHGDPGNLNFARVLEHAKATAAPADRDDGQDKPHAPAKPSVDLSKLVAAARTDPTKKGTPVSYDGTRTVERALYTEGLLSRAYIDGHFGTQTRAAYAAWQRRCGYVGDAADGIPGLRSLERLGKRHGFTVVA